MAIIKTTDENRPCVKLSQGALVGVTLRQNLPRPVEAFRGVPYALPPVGDRRFRAPIKLGSSSSEVIDASHYGPAAPGKQLFSGESLVYSEDCLTVNIFAQETQKDDDDGSKLSPVAIYIHGGAFNRGTSSAHNTASMLAWSKEPFVAVSFNHRLGALGFLPSAITAKEGVLNLGLKDQILLFEWVQENIRAFGGDPENVTLIGLSAGAHSIGHHLMNYKGGHKPLFHKVVIESGAPTSRAVRPYDSAIHEQQFRDFLRELECPDGIPDEQILPYLRSMSIEKISDAQNTVFDRYNPSLRWAFQPVIDGDIIPRPPLETWNLGLWHKVPIVTGFNRNEGSLYVDKSLSKSAEFTQFFKSLVPLFPQSDIDAIDSLYPDPLRYPDSPYEEHRKGVGAQYKRIEAAYGQYAYVAPARQTAELASASMSHPVYLYQWALISSELNGAQHGDNKDYEVCDPGVTKLSPTQRELAGTLNAYLTSFITTGDPNALRGDFPDRPRWESYDSKGRRKAMVFGEGNNELVGGRAGTSAAVLKDDEWARKESEFWWTKVDLSQQ